MVKNLFVNNSCCNSNNLNIIYSVSKEDKQKNKGIEIDSLLDKKRSKTFSSSQKSREENNTNKTNNNINVARPHRSTTADSSSLYRPPKYFTSMAMSLFQVFNYEDEPPDSERHFILRVCDRKFSLFSHKLANIYNLEGNFDHDEIFCEAQHYRTIKFENVQFVGFYKDRHGLFNRNEFNYEFSHINCLKYVNNACNTIFNNCGSKNEVCTATRFEQSSHLSSDVNSSNTPKRHSSVSTDAHVTRPLKFLLDTYLSSGIDQGDSKKKLKEGVFVKMFKKFKIKKSTTSTNNKDEDKNLLADSLEECCIKSGVERECYFVTQYEYVTDKMDESSVPNFNDDSLVKSKEHKETSCYMEIIFDGYDGGNFAGKISDVGVTMYFEVARKDAQKLHYYLNKLLKIDSSHKKRLSRTYSTGDLFPLKHSNNTELMSGELLSKLARFLPNSALHKHVNLLYSNAEHGTSFKRMMSNCQGYADEPCLLLVKDCGDCLAGAFLSETLHLGHSRFYGNGTSFVFNYNRRTQEFKVYKWKEPHKNSQFIHSSSESGVMIGSGREGHAIYICNDLRKASSYRSATFNNEPLFTQCTINLNLIEVYTLTDEEII